MPDVAVPVARFERWVANFAQGHGGATYAVTDGRLRGDASDHSWFTAALPFGRSYDGPADAPAFLADAIVPADWAVMLVRKGGFAIARMAGETIAASKVGQRHVQGRTKAGGWSQQRYARRRAHQADEAFGAAADHADRLLAGLSGPLVAGGEATAVAATRALVQDRALRQIEPVGGFLTVADPRRSVLEEAIGRALSVQVHVVNA
jgi:hypothetical protein